YDSATEAYQTMQRLGSGASVETRLARSALLHGRTDEAVRRLTVALGIAVAASTPRGETVAWVRWQIGVVEFLTGHYAAALQNYREALVTFPDYYRALAGSARSHAALGDFDQAIAGYERAVQIMPDPSFVAALGDLYQLTGRDKEAAAQYRLVE